MSDSIIGFIAAYIFFGGLFGLWYIIEILDYHKKVNWKAFPLYFLLGAPGIIFTFTVLAIVYPICWVMDNWPKNMGPFK